MYTTPLIVLAGIVAAFVAASAPFLRSAWKTFAADTSRGKAFTVVNVVMLLLLLLSVGVQYNDPDWLLWMIIYGYAAFVTWLAVGKKFSLLAPFGVVAYVSYAIYWMPDEMVEHPSNLLLDMRMHEKGVEEVREDMGLWICAAWMLAITVAWWTTRKAKSPDAAQEPSGAVE